MSSLSNGTRTFAIRCTITIVVACFAFATASAHATNRTIQHVNGVNPNTFGCNADNACVAVDAFLETGILAGNYFLVVSVSTPDGVQIFTSGDVPVSKFVVAHNGDVSLNIDLNALGFNFHRCDPSCADYHPDNGIVNVAWTVDNSFSSATTGTQVTNTPGFTTKLVGTTLFTPAFVNETVLGVQVPDATGGLNTLNNTTVTVTF